MTAESLNALINQGVNDLLTIACLAFVLVLAWAALSDAAKHRP